MGAKIRRGQLDKVPLLAIIGKREAESDQVAVRSRKNGDEGPTDIGAFLNHVTEEIACPKTAAR